MFIAVVRKNGDDHAARAKLILDLQRAEQTGAGGDADTQTQSDHQLLRHRDAIAIGNFDDQVMLVQFDDGRLNSSATPWMRW